MVDHLTRHAFEARAARALSPALISAAAAAAKAGDPGATDSLAAAFTYAAFFAPDVATETYDAFARGWLDNTQDSSPQSFRVAEPPIEGFWREFWALRDDTERGALDATELTGRVAGLGRFLAPSFGLYAEDVARTHPRGADAERRQPPRRLVLDELARAPKGSLGHAIHSLIVDNQFNLEVLDREELGLAALPPALRFHNTRILQMHDVWHLVGGFRTTVLHELAISSFQLAQFGHGYSAMLLATTATSVAASRNPGGSIVLQTIAEAWRHGCNTPSFMAIAWEEEWGNSIDGIRAHHGIVPFAGTFPADLFEQLGSQAA